MAWATSGAFDQTPDQTFAITVATVSLLAQLAVQVGVSGQETAHNKEVCGLSFWHFEHHKPSVPVMILCPRFYLMFLLFPYPFLCLCVNLLMWP